MIRRPTGKARVLAPQVYIATSWRNTYYDRVLKEVNVENRVYDWRASDSAFYWSDIDPDWKNWTTKQYVDALTHPIAEKGFERDLKGMRWASACILLLPCGRSAHLEAGWMAREYSTETVVYIPGNERIEPELMYLLGDHVLTSLDDVLSWLRGMPG